MEAKKLKKSNIILIVVASVLAIALIAFVVMYSVSMNTQQKLQTDLDNIYQRNFNELVDNVNNSQIKLSKVCVSDYDTYAKKMLNEISTNTTCAAINLSALPISINGIDDTIKFVNQVSGYTKTLANKLDKGESLTSTEISTLESLNNAFIELKNELNKLIKEVKNGDIYDQSLKLNGDYNAFTIKLQNVKAGDVEYPTMIYDGPFSDSVVNQKIKNMNFTKVSKDVAKQSLLNILKNTSVAECEYLGDTDGRFETYDYKIVNDNQNAIYVQVSKNGAKLLTMSAGDYDNTQNYTLGQAKQIAIDFTKLAGISDVECVWSDVVGGDAYLNLAPVKSGIILYPDLVKVKVDLATGMVAGFEASSYYTNHIQRNIKNATISQSQAEQMIPSSLTIKTTKLALAPLEYNREVLCYEMMCTKNDGTYYVYVNAYSGVLENILKIVESDNGNLLM